MTGNLLQPQQNPGGGSFGGNFLSSFQVPANNNNPPSTNSNLMKMRTNKDMLWSENKFKSYFICKMILFYTSMNILKL